MKLFFLILLFQAGLVGAQTSYVPQTQTLKEKGYQLGISGDYFSTQKIVDKDGKKISLEDGQKFERGQGEVSGFYGLTNQLQFGVGLRFRRNSSTTLDSSSEKVTESSSGVQSTFLNLMYSFKPVKELRYAIEGTFRYTPYKNSEVKNGSEESLILGDVGNEYSVGGAVTYATKKNNYLTFRGGYRKPGSDLSGEIYWQAEGALAFKYIAVVAGVDGVSSLKNDPYESDPENKPVYNTGVSALYNSTNREWIAPYAGFNVAFGQNWRVDFRASQVVTGRSTDLGTSFGIALVKRLENKNSAKQKVDSAFKEYDLEGTITKVSPKKGYVVIDKGLVDDVYKGTKFDFYDFDYVGGNVLLARGIVIQVKSDSAIVKITQTYSTAKELKEGVVGRATIR